MNSHKVLVFTGAGVSAESGISTFRDSGGLWDNYPVELVASPSGWRNNPKLVLEFYNRRRANAAQAQPNPAHIAIAELEKKFDVTVVTQNVDDLHERAGSSKVLHLHGELSKARSCLDENLTYSIGNKPIQLGDKCELDSQLRPHIVWFGEIPFFLDEAKNAFKDAAYVLVVGTSLQVEPAASLVNNAPFKAKKIMVTLEIEHSPKGFELQRGKAGQLVPLICRQWLTRA